ncbi:sialidase family protein [Paenibacillus eucommiae]|uniref:Sialidase domain-containing protein n=1 Tax=Paenibacillus eucommiae TaxID=1355755 RepID=A0ABS4J5N1_9BACL|nr:sialidase family protein [Paenibacillus eucommiae]MBP1995149.1 hypothetical protein [Paenibacillus eucommiae]
MSDSKINAEANTPMSPMSSIPLISPINSTVAQFLYEDSGLNLGPVIRLQDGSLFTVVCLTKKNMEHLDQAICSHYVLGRQSFDNGATWSHPHMFIAFPQQTGYISGQHYLQSKAGVMHVFSYRIQVLSEAANEYIGDILHTRADDIHGTNAVTQKVTCLDRYTGGLNSLLQLANGRIVVPFSTIPRGKSKEGSCFVCSTIYSDDEGLTWNASNDVEISDDNAHVESGAMEPIVLELDDTHMLMMMRTTLGRFYYAISADGGASWSKARPSSFRSSNAPTSLVRLANGDIVKIWNHCLGYRYIEGISYARQTLHAAISEDGGMTWSGYREIIRRRQDDHPKVLNCYAFPIVLEGDELLMKYFSVDSIEGSNFNDPNAKLVRFPTAFLKERTLAETFQNGMQAWNTDGIHTTLEKYQPDSSALEENMLLLSAGEGETAVAGLNFPYGRAGSLKIRLRADSGKELRGAALILSEPYVDEIHFTSKDEAIKNIKEIVLKDCVVLDINGVSNEWEEREISWDMDKRELHTTINGIKDQTIAITGNIGGFSYMTLCLEGAEGDIQRLSIAEVAAESHCPGHSNFELTV